MQRTAFFVKRPRYLDDLYSVHMLNKEEPYEIIHEVVLRGIEYVNFVEDMTVDRAFLDNFDVADCRIKQCVLVRRRNRANGILVVPTKDSHILYAAVYTGPISEAD